MIAIAFVAACSSAGDSDATAGRNAVEDTNLPEPTQPSVADGEAAKTTRADIVDPDEQNSQALLEPYVGTRWTLLAGALDGAPIRPIPDGKPRVTFGFDDDINQIRIEGTTGCNNFSTQDVTTTADGSIVVGDLNVNEELCLPAFAEQEDAVLSILRTADGIEFADNELRITAGPDSYLMYSLDS